MVGLSLTNVFLLQSKYEKHVDAGQASHWEVEDDDEGP